MPRRSHQPHRRPMPHHAVGQQMAQPQVANRRSSMKEDASVQLHDEADLISFRSDALNRFINNHEYLENVASKPIHILKIIPPASFPLEAPLSSKKNRISKPTKEQLSSLLKNIKPDELYFGDVDLMKAKNESLLEEIEELKQEKSQVFDNDSEYVYRKEKIDKLAGLHSKLYSSESIDDIEKELQQSIEGYQKKFGKQYKSILDTKRYSIPITEISSNYEITKAPANYNPRSINSLINIGGNNGGPVNLNNHDPNVDMSHFTGGMPFMNLMNNGGDHHDPNNPNNNQDFQNSTNNNNVTPRNNDIHKNSPGLTSSNIQASQTSPDKDNLPSDQQTKIELSNSTNNFHPNDIHISNDDLGLSVTDNDKANEKHDGSLALNQDSHHQDHAGMVDDDINHLLSNGNDVIDSNHLGIVNDDMGDLINFQDEDEDGMMSSHAFDNDFLSQIDHSME